jgi:hypothetical protein
VNAVAASARADGDDRISDALRHGANELVLVHQADAHRVDERIALVRRIERDLAGDGRYADAIAVVADAFHHAAEEIPDARRVEGAEPERIEHRDRPRAHGKHVAQDAADARRRALIGLDGRRVVVRLDLERHREAVADADHAGVLTGSLQHERRLGGERLEQRARMLVRAVLAPQRADDAQLSEGRLAPQHVDESAILVRRESVFGDERRGDGGIAGTRLDLRAGLHRLISSLVSCSDRV